MAGLEQGAPTKKCHLMRRGLWWTSWGDKQTFAVIACFLRPSMICHNFVNHRDMNRSVRSIGIYTIRVLQALHTFGKCWRTIFLVPGSKASLFYSFRLWEELSSAIKIAIDARESISELRKQKCDHVLVVIMERMNNHIKQNNARLYPAQFCSIIVAGVDQYSLGLPHFVKSKKDVRDRALNARLIGVLDHLKPNKIHLFRMTEEHRTGANQIAETVHRFIADHVTSRPLLPTFYIQIKNCTRENINHFLMSYIEDLLWWISFRTIELPFFASRHTFEDIHRAFSRSSKGLRSSVAVILPDFEKKHGLRLADRLA